MLNVSRRNLLIGSAATLICAPAIVRASSLMAVKAMKPWEAYCASAETIEVGYEYRFRIAVPGSPHYTSGIVYSRERAQEIMKAFSKAHLDAVAEPIERKPRTSNRMLLTSLPNLMDHVSL